MFHFLHSASEEMTFSVWYRCCGSQLSQQETSVQSLSSKAKEETNPSQMHTHSLTHILYICVCAHTHTLHLFKSMVAFIDFWLLMFKRK